MPKKNTLDIQILLLWNLIKSFVSLNSTETSEKTEIGKRKTQNHYVSIVDVSCVSIGDNPFGTEQFEIEKAVTRRGRNPYSSSMLGSEIIQEWQSRNDWESRDFFRPAPYTFSILDIKGYTMAHSEAGEELKVKAVL
jgi:hypothetical protein